MDKARVFFFHYNKPASHSAGKPQITIHYQKKCVIVDNVVCNVPVKGHLNKRQPHFVMKGKVKPSQFTVKDNVAYLN